MRRLLLAGALLLMLAPAAAAQNITIVNQAHVPKGRLGKVEMAVTVQVQRDFDLAWPTMPSVTFARGGWRVYLVDSNDPHLRYEYLYGWHSFTRRQGPYAYVGVGGLYDPWSATLSHEVLEMLADPQASGREVCDPVSDHNYRIAGVQVSDFVTPSYFVPLSAGPWDFLRFLLHGR